MINTAISAPRYASRLTPDTMYMPAATSVEIEIIESNNASLPDAISDSELILVPTDFTYLPSSSFTATAAPTIISETFEYYGVSGLKIFFIDS